VAAVVGCSLTLHRGLAVATPIDDRMAYYGQTLARTLELSSALGARELSVTSAALVDAANPFANDPGLTSTLRPEPLLGPAAWCLHIALHPAPDANEAAA